MEMDSFSRKLCDIQGRLFVLSARKGLDSADFIKQFMQSDVARRLDSVYDHLQWAGEEYLLEELTDICRIHKGEVYPEETMYWTGYLYRYWHYATKESSKQILRQASPGAMRVNYFMFHTMDNDLAIDDLKEIYQQSHKKAKAV